MPNCRVEFVKLKGKQGQKGLKNFPLSEKEEGSFRTFLNMQIILKETLYVLLNLK